MAFYSQTYNSKVYRLGAVKKDYAGNEYVFLKGVASLAAGDWVFYDELGATVRAVTSSVGGPMAVAMAAPDGSTTGLKYGWFCIKSLSIVANCVNDTFADDSEVFISATAGSVDDDTGAGRTVYGAISRAAGATTHTTFQIVYPFCINGAPA